MVDYKNNYTKVKIICSKHGVFEQIPKDHKKGLKCLKCVGYGKTTKDIIKEFKVIHGNKYNYSLVDYKNCSTKVKIICPEHGEFLQKPNHHLRMIGCPSCSFSKGETMISQIVTSNLIKHNVEHKFKDCININHLPFDFYLLDYNTCIEFHGEQHFKSIKFFGGIEKLKERQKRDKIKEEYCKNNSIPLIVVFNSNKKSNPPQFVDLYDNSDDYIKKILLKNNIKQMSRIQYNEFVDGLK